MLTSKSENHISTLTVFSLGRSAVFQGYPTDEYFSHLADPGAELQLLSMLSSILKPGQVVFDVGANLGFVSVFALKLMDGRGSVYSFEPSPTNFSLLKNNIKINGLQKKIKAFNYGLSDRKAVHELSFSDGNRGGAFISDNTGSKKHADHTEKIETKVLDDIAAKLSDKCDFIKVDIEGHEPNFLRGARKFLLKHKPACIIEANHWCLNAFNNTTMPDFIKQVSSIFPFVYAFDGQSLVNVKENQFLFLYDNLVHNRLQNLYCDFDEQRCRRAVAAYQGFLANNFEYIVKVEEENTRLRSENSRLITEVELLKRSKAHLVAKRINKIMGR